MPERCRCPRLLSDAGSPDWTAHAACLDRGGHDWVYDGSTCCLDVPRNWRQACHCGVRRWTVAPSAGTAGDGTASGRAPTHQRLDRLLAGMGTVPLAVER